MVSVVKKDTGSFLYMRVMKHNCPVCGKQMKVVRMTKKVRSKTKEVKGFNFVARSLSHGEKVKLIWYEFECKACNKTYGGDELRVIEKKKKKEQKAAQKAEKKAERIAEKQTKKAVSKETENAENAAE